ncbi:hypothetical protein [Streptomyces reniochalinae]|uniref:hypothetical protein n=1 Tax=Streptomyces reniochalinae TaxID=2250578 RepID=UPI0015F09E52|nr:hypothetical protein [Streptomyces reniochalinae]
MTASVAKVMNESFTVAVDGSYAARLTTRAGTELWYPERWTLGGPEPYAVPLPVKQPEDPGSGVLPLADGRVLIARPAPGHHSLALLYPSGPDTGELRLGTVETDELRLLPPAPCGTRAYALAAAPGGRATDVWQVTPGAPRALERVARIGARCFGGAWLDPEGRLLAVEAQGPGGEGPTKTVAVDLAAGGAVSPLLQITEQSNDRLLLADPDSGLLLVSSDAPGEERLGWGVLGSHRPVRFPEVLHPSGTRLTPIAVQPGQTLLPERCGVAFRVDAAQGTWPAVWRPGLRELRHVASPPGWLTGKGLWTADGELRVPYSTAHNPCGLARMRAPLPDGEEPAAGTQRRPEDPTTGTGTPAPGADTPPLPAPPAPRTPPRAAAPAPAPASAPPSSLPPSPPSSAAGPKSPPPSPDPVPPAPPAPSPGAGEPPRQAEPQQQAGPPASGPGGDVTALQHRGHGGPPSGLLGSLVRRAVSAGGTGSFGALGEAARKPVPLQQAPLPTGTA